MSRPIHHNARATLGILYAEDFGRLAPDQPVAAGPPQPPAISQSDVDAACIRAVQAAQNAWAASAAERRADALAAITAAMADARSEAACHAEAVADGVARTALAMVAALLPGLCRAHGDDEVRTIVGRLAPLLARDGKLVLRVHPGLVETLAHDIATLDDGGAIELRPANLPPGDIRMSWADGTLVRDTAAIGAAMQQALGQLGLDAVTVPPDAAPPNRPERAPALQSGSLTLAQ